MTLFLHPAFYNPYFGPFFYRVTNRPMFLRQEWWVQIDWANGSKFVSERAFLFFLICFDRLPESQCDKYFNCSEFTFAEFSMQLAFWQTVMHKLKNSQLNSDSNCRCVQMFACCTGSSKIERYVTSISCL